MPCSWEKLEQFLVIVILINYKISLEVNKPSPLTIVFRMQYFIIKFKFTHPLQ